MLFQEKERGLLSHEVAIKAVRFYSRQLSTPDEATCGVSDPLHQKAAMVDPVRRHGQTLRVSEVNNGGAINREVITKGVRNAGNEEWTAQLRRGYRKSPILHVGTDGRGADGLSRIRRGVSETDYFDTYFGRQHLHFAEPRTIPADSMRRSHENQGNIEVVTEQLQELSSRKRSEFPREAPSQYKVQAQLDQIGNAVLRSHQLTHFPPRLENDHRIGMEKDRSEIEVARLRFCFQLFKQELMTEVDPVKLPDDDSATPGAT